MVDERETSKTEPHAEDIVGVPLAEETRAHEEPEETETATATRAKNRPDAERERRTRLERLAEKAEVRLKRLAKILDKNERRLTAEIERLRATAADLEERLATLDMRTRKAAETARRLFEKGEKGNQRASELQSLYVMATRFAIPVRQPLVLISQAPRSGGTLLSQLFDGHPQCWPHPYEVYLGYPSKAVWPKLDLSADPELWFDILREPPAAIAAAAGYKKTGEGKFPFFFLPQHQRELFLLDLATHTEPTERVVFDAYFTSYFNAWLNFRFRSGDKRCVTGFVPDLATRAESVAGMFAVYPDGKLISLVREPASWAGSARSYFAGKGRSELSTDLEAAIALWIDSTEACLRNRELYGDSVLIVRYEDLVQRTEAVMSMLASRIGIEFDPILLRPTFNGHPIGPNSRMAKAEASERGESDVGRIVESPLRRAEVLAPEERELVARRTEEVYASVLAIAARP